MYVRLSLRFDSRRGPLALAPFIRKLRLDIRVCNGPLVGALLLPFQRGLQFFDVNSGLVPGGMGFPPFTFDP